MKETLFPLQEKFFESWWLEGSLFLCFMFLLLFSSCVVCFNLNNELLRCSMSVLSTFVV